MNALLNVRIRTKLMGGFTAVLLLTVFLGLFSVATLAAVRATTVDMADHWLPAVVVLGDMRKEVLNLRRGQYLFQLSKSKTDRAAATQLIDAANGEFKKGQAKYVPLISGPEAQKTYDEIVAATDEFAKTETVLQQLNQQGKQAAALEYLLTTQKASYERLLAALNADIAFNQQGAEKSNKLSAEIYSDARLWVWSVLGCTIALGLALALGIAQSISRPVQAACVAACQIAAGDLTAQDIDVRSSDEVGLLGKSINEMHGSMRKTILGISHNARQLASSSEELSAVSTQMGANAEETSAQSNVVAAAAEQVSSCIQTVAAGAEEMMASIKEIAKNSCDAARVATQAVKIAEATNTTVAKLGDSSAEIGQVIKVITSIAQQTNLLALNATIEAARAGEAGKGFAVVANEVKELAKETAKATEDISSKIEAIQTDTRAAVDAIAEISGIIRQINDIQNTIASAVEEQSATTNEIGRNIGEASKGSSEIAQNIGGVAQAAKSTAEGAGNSQAASAELARMATELQRLVSQFNIGSSNSAFAARPKQSLPNNVQVIGRKAA
jgi:methyl-accepting chemotaxis protein